VVKAVAEVGTPANALGLVYQGLAAAVVWGLVIGGVAAWIAAAVRSGGGKDSE
jgi:hypothetical protein